MRGDLRNIPIPFPLKGLHEGSAFAYQPEGSTGDALNVWPWDSITGRARGGQRPGTKKLYASAVSTGNPIQALHKFVEPLSYTGALQRGGVFFGNISAIESGLLNASDMTSIWTSNVKGDGVGYALFTGDGLIYCAGSSGTVWAIYHNDGTLAWTASPSSSMGACFTMVEDKRGDLVVVGNLRMASFTKAGVENWNVATPSGLSPGDNCGAVYRAANDTLYIGANRTGASTIGYVKIDCSDGTTSNGYDWGDTTTADNVKGAVLHDDKIFFVHDDDGTAGMYVIDPSDDSLLWRGDLTMNGRAVVVYDNRMFIGGDDDEANGWDLLEIDWDQSTTDGSTLAYSTIAIANSGTTTHPNGVSDMTVDNAGNLYITCDRTSGDTQFKVHVDDLTTDIATHDSSQAQSDIIAVRQDRVAAAESLRDIWLMAVSNGRIYSLNSGVLTDESGATDLVTGIGEVQVTDAFGKAYFVDGTNYIQFDPGGTAGSKTSTWQASSGSLPVTGSDRARLITTWRGRVVLSGVAAEPHNIFASQVGDPTNFDYAPTEQSPTDAWALNSSSVGLGKVGDVVTSLIPYNKDILLIGCDSSIWMLQGDPMDGGVLDSVSQRIGMAWGNPWAQDDDGIVYFFASHGGVYRMQPGMAPQSLSDYRLKNTFASIDLDANIIRMAWDVRNEGLHVYVIDRNERQTTHYFWDKRTDSWWPMQFPAAQTPTAIGIYDGGRPDDRHVVLGGKDSILRIFDQDEKNDDATAINAYFDYTPLRPGANMMDTRLAGLYPVVATGSGAATTLAVRDDESSEQADTAATTFTATLSGTGRLAGIRTRARGKSLIIRAANSTVDQTFAMEDLTAVIHPGGRTRG